MAEQTEINAGDVVRLKSGGPLMTVVIVRKPEGGTSPSCYCNWFDGCEKKGDEFNLVALELSEERVAKVFR